MSWTHAEALERAHLLRLYAAGNYRTLCEDYCHEGWHYGLNDAGELVQAGICSYHVYEGPEELALAECAAHIHAEILAGILGC
jgi:hypothetical protein